MFQIIYFCEKLYLKQSNEDDDDDNNDEYVIVCCKRKDDYIFVECIIKLLILAKLFCMTNIPILVVFFFDSQENHNVRNKSCVIIGDDFFFSCVHLLFISFLHTTNKKRTKNIMLCSVKESYILKY